MIDAGLHQVEQAQASIVYSMYAGIEEFWVNLSINGSGIAECEAYLSTSISGCTPAISVILKRTSNGQTRSSVQSWYDTGTYLAGASIDKTIAVASRYQYKLFATGRIFNSKGMVIETAYKNSATATY